MSKPYKFIPFIKTQPYKVKNDKLSGRIDLELKVLNAIHLSKGIYELNEKNVLYKQFFRIDNKYTIPGTSIKGMVRNIAEIVSHSCISFQKKEFKLLPQYKRTSCKNEYCIICDLFGAMGKRSKIKISDFLYEDGSGKSTILGMPTLRTPKINNSYMENEKLKGYKLYNHGIKSILKKGSENCQCFLEESIFKGYVLYEDLDLQELELLCYSLGLSNSFNHKIGYGKPSYYGSIQINALDKKYKEYAEEYENISDKDIKLNIKLLAEEYSYKNAKKIADYEELTY
ncbi:MAG: hypothetical protein E7214_10710 [Clostridium sp.]|nr:hypothetical protein [Clostridium sp.]